MKISILATALVSSLLTGCVVNPQPVNYTDTSTADQRNIQATGAAAVEAARSNRSINTNINSEQSLRVQRNNYLIGINAPIYDRYGNEIILLPDGIRDFDAEARAIYESRDYNYRAKQSGYTGYADREIRRQTDYEIKKKIRAETGRLMDRIF